MGLVICGLLGPTPVLAESVLRFETVHDVLAVTSDQIVDATPIIGAQGFSVAFELDPSAGAKFSEVTARAVGTEMRVYLCDELLIRPVVQDRLKGRGLLPARGIEHADLVAEQLRGDLACDAVLR